MGNIRSPKKQQIRQDYLDAQLINFNYKELKLDLEGLNFAQSSINILSENNVRVEKIDKEIRNSKYSFVQNQILSAISDYYLNEYLESVRCQHPYYYEPVNDKFRIVKYDKDGYFKRHSDRQKFLQGYVHFGTQIFIPPLSQVFHEGGELCLFRNGKIVKIRPQNKKWSHIIIPLGNDHEVKKVTKGYRISLIRQIWFKERHFIQTDQDYKRSRENRRIQSQNFQIQFQQRRQRFKNVWGNENSFFTD